MVVCSNPEKIYKEIGWKANKIFLILSIKCINTKKLVKQL